MKRRPTRRRGPYTGQSETTLKYGAAHQKLRKKLKPLVESGVVRCCIGGEIIKPGTPWHVAHADVPNAHELGLYMGALPAACARHNNATNRRRLARGDSPNKPNPAEEFFGMKSVPPSPVRIKPEVRRPDFPPRPGHSPRQIRAANLRRRDG